MKLKQSDFQIGSYFYRNNELVQIDNSNIFVAWKFPEYYTPVPLVESVFDKLPGRKYFGGIKFKEIIIQAAIGSDSFMVGFIDILGIPTYMNKEIKFLHQLQKICLQINEEPLEFIKE